MVCVVLCDLKKIHYGDMFIVLSVGHMRTNFNEVWIPIQTYIDKKMHLKLTFATWWWLCSGEWRQLMVLLHDKMPYLHQPLWHGCVNTLRPDDSYMCQRSGSSLVFNAKETNLQCECSGITSLSLQRRHNTILLYQITDNSKVCLAGYDVRH